MQFIWIIRTGTMSNRRWITLLDNIRNRQQISYFCKYWHIRQILYRIQECTGYKKKGNEREGVHMCVHACKIRVRGKKWYVNKAVIYGKACIAYNIITLRYNRRGLSETMPSRSKHKNDKEMISRRGIPCRENKTIAKIRRAWLCRLYRKSAYHRLSCCIPSWRMDRSIELL